MIGCGSILKFNNIVRIKLHIKLQRLYSVVSSYPHATSTIWYWILYNIELKFGGNILYDNHLRTVIKDGKNAKLIENFKIPAKDAKSWKVKAGNIWRIVCTDGPQVADMNCWSINNPKEKFYSSKTILKRRMML